MTIKSGVFPIIENNQIKANAEFMKIIPPAVSDVFVRERSTKTAKLYTTTFTVIIEKLTIYYVSALKIGLSKKADL